MLKDRKYRYGWGRLFMFMTVFLVGFMKDGTKASADNTDQILNQKGEDTGSHAHLTTDDSVRHMVNHPAFKGFGRYLLPRDKDASDFDRPLNQVGSLMPYHSHVDPDIVVAAINHMTDKVNDGDTIFYDFYTEYQKREDPAKASAGLFFFKGQPGAS